MDELKQNIDEIVSQAAENYNWSGDYAESGITEALTALFSAELAKKDEEIEKLHREIMDYQVSGDYVKGEENAAASFMHHLRNYQYPGGNSELCEVVKSKIDDYQQLRKRLQELEAMSYTNSAQVSDGDNDYIIPVELEARFDELMQAWEKTQPYSEEWYDACAVITNEFGQYQR